KFLPWVQALRALAAFSVAFSHVEFDAANNGGDPSGLLNSILKFFPWYGGVDIFFVISGFVIVHASALLFKTAHGPITFLGRRLARIVPLYWIVTTLFILMLLLDRSAIHGDIGSPVYCLAGYFFIPVMRPDGLVQPAYGLGWTLNYEMFFYLVFTPFILLSRHKAVLGVVGLLGLLVLVGQTFGFHNTPLLFWSNPIILEFCAGMVIALLFAKGIRMPEWLRPVLVVVAITALHINATISLNERAWAFGIPATILVMAAGLGRANRHEPDRALVGTSGRCVLRDVSYPSLYHAQRINIMAAFAPRLRGGGDHLCCVGAGHRTNFSTADQPVFGTAPNPLFPPRRGFWIGV
ncbi:MAG TPA: acyltransferase, partial [Acidocella sp.]|nr:acyltransferase [Acidocella sp.]